MTNKSISLTRFSKKGSNYTLTRTYCNTKYASPKHVRKDHITFLLETDLLKPENRTLKNRNSTKQKISADLSSPGILVHKFQDLWWKDSNWLKKILHWPNQLSKRPTAESWQEYKVVLKNNIANIWWKLRHVRQVTRQVWVTDSFKN